jgi:mycothiol synthase
MTYRVEALDLDSLSDDDIVPILGGVNAVNREIQPRHVDTTASEFRTFAKSPGMVKVVNVVHDASGHTVGTFDTRYSDDGTNPDVLRFEMKVFPEHRRRGAGTAMLAHAARHARDLGRTTLLTWHFDTVPAGIAFARACNGADKLQFHENVLQMADLDIDLMEEWSRRDPTGYAIRIVEGSIPDELLAGVANLYYILERDMPLSEGQEPRTWTAELIREMTENYLQEVESLVAVATTVESGLPVGLSQLIRRKSDPSTWVVTTTMVDPDHRGRSIGKWLKGTVNMVALERWPGVVYQETGNAFVNEAMLAINHAMGFEHEMTVTDVEILVDDALEFVDSRS